MDDIRQSPHNGCYTANVLSSRLDHVINKIHSEYGSNLFAKHPRKVTAAEADGSYVQSVDPRTQHFGLRARILELVKAKGMPAPSTKMCRPRQVRVWNEYGKINTDTSSR